MNELDKRLAESLKMVTAALRENREARAVRARSDFWRRYRRRRVTRFTSVVAVAGATAVIAAFAVTQGGDLFKRGPVKATVVPAPPAGTYIGVAADPVGVSIGNGIVWVASKNGMLTQVDPETNSSIFRIPVGGKPSDVAVTDDFAWYSDSADGTVKRVSTTDAKFVGAPVDVASHGHIDIDVGPKGTIWATSLDTGTLYGIDATTGDLRKQLFVDRPVELGIGPGVLWVLGDDGLTLVRFDFATGAESLRVSIEGTAKTDLAVTDGHVFVASADGTVTQIDAVTGDIVSEITAAGTNPELAVGRGTLWVASDIGDGDGELARFDVAHLRSSGKPARFRGTPTDIALGEGSVWVTDASRDAVIRLSP